jgi:chemotaxis protein CheD
MGEIKHGDSSGAIGCHGLGSCIAIFAFDARSSQGWVIHVVLPESDGRPADDLEGRYMDRAFDALARLVSEKGLSFPRLKFVAVGGANVFKFGGGSANLNLEIGARNIESLKQNLAKRGLRLTAEKLGGDRAASTYLCLDSGEVYVASNTREFGLLASLKEGSFVRTAA